MSIKNTKSKMLSIIKEHYAFKSDSEFARFLGIKPQTLSTWHSRDSFDIYLLYAKCEGVNAEWLLSGQGIPFLSGEAMPKNRSAQGEIEINLEMKKKFIALLAKDDDISEIFDLKVKTIVNLFLAELKTDLILDGTLEKYIEEKIRKLD
ncbi:helix-turn-helix domain-containing protein [Kordia sp.]|uniref:helix-turn-helix domain-containing protein n=1 Tax=Kordia sp. TaxID=1965332 RepID=UPI003D26A906